MLKLLQILLEAIKNDDGLAFLSGFVFIIPEGPGLDFLPEETSFPCLALSDGGTVFEERLHKRKIATHQVRISAYCEVVRPERSIVGDAVTRGVIDVTDLVIKSLEYNTAHKDSDDNSLNDLSYTTANLRLLEAGTAFDQGRVLAKKTAVFEYRQNI